MHHFLRMAAGVFVAEMFADKAAATVFPNGASPTQAQLFIAAWYATGAWAGAKFIPI